MTDPELSPPYGDFSGLPPMLLMAGGEEALRDDAVRAARRAEEAGADVTLVVSPGLPHIWPWFVPEAPESRQAYEIIAAFFEKLETHSHRS